MSNLDLNNMPPDLQATLIKKETIGERWIRLAKDMTVFILALIVVVAAAIWSGWTISQSSASADDKHTAQTILIAIVAACAGYMLKK